MYDLGANLSLHRRPYELESLSRKASVIENLYFLDKSCLKKYNSKHLNLHAILGHWDFIGKRWF